MSVVGPSLARVGGSLAHAGAAAPWRCGKESPTELRALLVGRELLSGGLLQVRGVAKPRIFGFMAWDNARHVEFFISFPRHATRG